MSGQTFCKTCDREVEGSLKYHQRCAHFTKVKVIWPEGSMEKIQRNGDTDEFMCSRCEFSSADPNSLKVCYHAIAAFMN